MSESFLDLHDRRAGALMFAAAGDRLIVHGSHVGAPVRDGEVLEVRRADGGPPYVVRWSDNGHEALVFPGPDAEIHHFERARPAGTIVPSRPPA